MENTAEGIDLSKMLAVKQPHKFEEYVPEELLQQLNVEARLNLTQAKEAVRQLLGGAAIPKLKRRQNE